MHIKFWLIGWLIISARLFAAEPYLQLVTLEYPPYITQVGGHTEGLVVDIVNEVFSRMGQGIEIGVYPWSRSLHMLNIGQADALFTIKKTPEREISMLFPKESLISQDYVFFKRRDSSFNFDGDYASIADASIGIVQDTSYGARFDEAVKQGRFKRLDSAVNYELTFRKLLGGRVDAVICSHLVGLRILQQQRGLDQVVVSGPPSETAVSYLVFTRSKDHSKLAAAFDRHIARMKKDGTIKKMTTQYRATLTQ